MFSDEQRLARWAPSQWPVAASWRACVDGFFSSAAGVELGRLVAERIDAGAVVFPPAPLRALELTPSSQVQVVVLGQDPYHGPGQANGLAFSVAPGVKVPPSLRNMYLELDDERRFWPPGAGDMPAPMAGRNGDLTNWARQGVLLLNAALSVEEGRPGSHAGVGWEVLTDEIIQETIRFDRPLVCMLWGAQAQRKGDLIVQSRRHAPLLLLRANHPSPLSARRPPAPFMGCGHFVAANRFLRENGASGIDW